MSKKASKSLDNADNVNQNQAIDFELTLNELESVVQKMENGELSLEDSLKNFEIGIKLARNCQQALKAAEHKVQLLMEENGELKTESFLVEEH